MPFTTVPTVLSALVTLGTTTLPGIQVYDGAPDVDNLPDEFLCVGFSRDEEEASVDGQLTDEGNRDASETYSVHCILSVATGDTEPDAPSLRRARVLTLVSTFASALRANPSLGVLTGGGRADFGSFAWIYGPTANGGSYAEIEFDVDVSAYYLGLS